MKIKHMNEQHNEQKQPTQRDVPPGGAERQLGLLPIESTR